MSGIFIPRPIAEKLEADDRKAKLRAAFQLIYREAYFNAFDPAIRPLRYGMIRSLAENMMGETVEFEELT